MKFFILFSLNIRLLLWIFGILPVFSAWAVWFFLSPLFDHFRRLERLECTYLFGLPIIGLHVVEVRDFIKNATTDNQTLINQKYRYRST
jgi:hypothetical protein